MIKQSFETEGPVFKVMLYADPHTELRPHYVENALKRDLGREVQGLPTELISVNRHNFESVMKLEKPKVIFIPENLNSQSHHMRDLSPETIKTLRKFVGLGGTLVLFGGASHYAMQKIVWHWDDGTIIYKAGTHETFGYVAGKIVGPHIRHLGNDDVDISHNGCFKVSLLVPNGNTMMGEECWQGNCGQFILNDQRTQAGVEDLAYYSDGNIAAVNVPHGTRGGNFILCSVMPHYHPRAFSPLWDKILTIIETKKYGVQSQVRISIKL